MHKTVERRNHHQHLANVASALIKPVLAKNGFNDEKLILYWPQIVGEYLAQFAFPKKISLPTASGQYGQLLIEVYNPGFALEIQAMESIITERIATYLGYKSIFRIKTIVAKSKPAAKPAAAAQHLSACRKALSTQTAADIENLLNRQVDNEVTQALHSLYKSMFYVADKV